MGRRRIEEMPETVTDNRSKFFFNLQLPIWRSARGSTPRIWRSSLRGTWRSTSYLAALFYSHKAVSIHSYHDTVRGNSKSLFFWCDEIGSWTHDAWLKCLTTSAHVRCRRSFFGFCFPFSSVCHPSQAIYRRVVRPFVNGEEFQLAGSRLEWENVCVAKESGRKEVSNTI